MLDIDHTLVHALGSALIVRVGARELLDAAAALGFTVGLWTLGNGAHAVRVARALGPTRFAFLWDVRAAAPLPAVPAAGPVKCLERLWAAFPAAGPANTVLIDDSAVHCAYNAPNAVRVPPFVAWTPADEAADDGVLRALAARLPALRAAPDVRPLLALAPPLLAPPLLAL